MSKEKFVRPWQRFLTEQEFDFRLSGTKQVIQKLREDNQWNGWITGATLFGSMARHKAKTGSDIDVAILTHQGDFFGLDFSYITSQLREAICRIQHEMSIEGFKIDALIVPEEWLSDPQCCPSPRAEVLQQIKKEGISLF